MKGLITYDYNYILVNIQAVFKIYNNSSKPRKYLSEI